MKYNNGDLIIREKTTSDLHFAKLEKNATLKDL